MFIAKFSSTTGAPFKADKNGVLPLIGDVVAGTSKGTLINGTMFQRNGLQTNTLYACENFVDPEYPDNTQVKVISKVGIVEFLELRAILGEGKTVLDTVATEAPVVEEPVQAEA